MKSAPRPNQSPFRPETTVEDIMADPHKFGCPSFPEYCKQRDKWNPTGRGDSAMAAISDGPKMFRRDLQKIRYQIHGQEMPEDHIERALSDFGFTLADVDLENRNSKLKKEINMVPQGGGKYDLVVNFQP